jgi:hypothetical protein
MRTLLSEVFTRSQDNKSKLHIFYQLANGLGMILLTVAIYVILVGLCVILGIIRDKVINDNICDTNKEFVTYVSGCANIGITMIVFYVFNLLTYIAELATVIIIIYLGIESIPYSKIKRVLLGILIVLTLWLPIFFNLGLSWLSEVAILNDTYCGSLGDLTRSLNIHCITDGIYHIGAVLMGFNVLILVVTMSIICIQKCIQHNAPPQIVYQSGTNRNSRREGYVSV